MNPLPRDGRGRVLQKRPAAKTRMYSPSASAAASAAASASASASPSTATPTTSVPFLSIGTNIAYDNIHRINDLAIPERILSDHLISQSLEISYMETVIAICGAVIHFFMACAIVWFYTGHYAQYHIIIIAVFLYVMGHLLIASEFTLILAMKDRRKMDVVVGGVGYLLLFLHGMYVCLYHNVSPSSLSAVRLYTGGMFAMVMVMGLSYFYDNEVGTLALSGQVSCTSSKHTQFPNIQCTPEADASFPLWIVVVQLLVFLFIGYNYISVSLFGGTGVQIMNVADANTTSSTRTYRMAMLMLGGLYLINSISSVVNIKNRMQTDIYIKQASR